MKKQIVSETKQYQPSFPDELLLDDTPKVNSFNGVTSDGVARAIAGASGEVPVVTESDNGKVLKAIYDEGGPAVEWGEATVDQTYDSTSTNAQSGTAVAQALAAIPSASYTAGDGIAIENAEISVKAGTGLEISDASSTVTGNLYCSEYYTDIYATYAMCAAPLTSDILNAINTSGGFSFTTSRQWGAWGDAIYVALYRYADGTPGFNAESYVIFGTALTSVSNNKIPNGTTLTLKASEVNASLSTVTLSDVASSISAYRIGILRHTSTSTGNTLSVGCPALTEAEEQNPPSSIVTATYSTPITIQDALCVSLALGGVTHIQQVNALPATPDANTLYLIPEA